MILGLNFCVMNSDCSNELGKTCFLPAMICVLGDHHLRCPLTTAGTAKRRAQIVFPLLKSRCNLWQEKAL